MKGNILFFLVILFFASCKEPIARRPKKHGTTNFYRDIIKENKKIIDLENKIIEKAITKDTLSLYKNSPNGFWYTYNVKLEDDLPNPKSEDSVVIEFDIQNLNGDIVYSKEEIGRKVYKIDKEDFIPGLQDGIKLMKIGETITFVIPSYRGFGVIGDGNKIGINQTIKSTVTLIDIKSNINNESN